MKMEQAECSETSVYKLQTPGNYPEESILLEPHLLLQPRHIFGLRMLAKLLLNEEIETDGETYKSAVLTSRISIAVLPGLHYDTKCPSRYCLACTMTLTVHRDTVWPAL